jgi:hypothetical protein
MSGGCVGFDRVPGCSHLCASLDQLPRKGQHAEHHVSAWTAGMAAAAAGMAAAAAGMAAAECERCMWATVWVQQACGKDKSSSATQAVANTSVGNHKQRATWQRTRIVNKQHRFGVGLVLLREALQHGVQVINHLRVFECMCVGRWKR